MWSDATTGKRRGKLWHAPARWLVFAGLLVSPPASQAATGPDSVIAAIALYNKHEAVALPTPSAAEIDDLLEGQVVKYRLRTEMEGPGGTPRQRIRIVGYRLIEQPRMLVWLAALDVGTSHAERLTEHLIWSDLAGGSIWYQYLRLPWPLKSRHWVILNFKKSALTAATNGAVWEHAWRLEDGGRKTALEQLDKGDVASLDRRDGERAIYLPINRGGWTMIALNPELTLVAVHVVTELGGIVPDRLVASLVSRQLNGMLNGLEPRATIIHEQYDASYPIFTGNAQLITREMAGAAAEH